MLVQVISHKSSNNEISSSYSKVKYRWSLFFHGFYIHRSQWEQLIVSPLTHAESDLAPPEPSKGDQSSASGLSVTHKGHMQLPMASMSSRMAEKALTDKALGGLWKPLSKEENQSLPEVTRAEYQLSLAGWNPDLLPCSFCIHGVHEWVCIWTCPFLSTQRVCWILLYPIKRLR